MSTSPFDTIYNTFIDDSDCVEEHVATPGAPKATPQTSMEEYLALEKQELEYAAAVSPQRMPGLPQASPSSSTVWDGDSYLTNLGSSRVCTPGPPRLPQTPDRSGRYHPYSPSKWGTPKVTSTSVRPVNGMRPGWDLGFYQGFGGVLSPRPRSGSTRSPARAIFSSLAPRPHVRSDDKDIFLELAASASSPTMAPRSPGPSGLSRFHSGSPSGSRDAPTTSPDAAFGKEGRESSDEDEDEPQLEAVVVTDPASTTTINVYPQPVTVGGGVAAAGQGLIPLPADRDALLDRLQEGVHIQCILPSVRNSATNIVCVGQHFLQPDGSFTEGDACWMPFGSQDSYGRHVKVRHMGMDPTRTLGALDVKRWIRQHRPGVYIEKENPGLVVQGARPREKDLPRRRRA